MLKRVIKSLYRKVFKKGEYEYAPVSFMYLEKIYFDSMTKEEMESMEYLSTLQAERAVREKWPHLKLKDYRINHVVTPHPTWPDFVVYSSYMELE